MMSFDGFSPWSLVILCDQSVSINRVTYTDEYTSSNIAMLFVILVICPGKVWGTKYLFLKVKLSASANWDS
jgi:hypothetical protein